MLAHYAYLAGFAAAFLALLGAASVVLVGYNWVKAVWPRPKREISARLAAQLLIAEEAGRARIAAQAEAEKD